jgi:uncharacterized lipoprotein YmbA
MKQLGAIRCACTAVLLVLAGCQATRPVYQTYYLPEAETTDATAAVRAAEARCNEQAAAEASAAFQTAYSRAEVNIPQVHTTNSGVPLGVTPTQSAAGVAYRAAMTQAQAASSDTYASAMTTCMADAGFRQLSVCVANCPD